MICDSPYLEQIYLFWLDHIHSPETEQDNQEEQEFSKSSDHQITDKAQATSCHTE